MFGFINSYRPQTLFIGALLLSGIIMHALMLCSGVGMFLSCPVGQALVMPNPAVVLIMEKLDANEIKTNTKEPGTVGQITTLEELFSSGILNPKNPHSLV